MNVNDQQLPQSRYHKVIENSFKWVPLDKRKSKFGGPMTPRKAELRNPLLWLAREGKELYLVNSSAEIIDFVGAGTGGFQTVDDDCISVSSKKKYKYEYKNVKLNDAVKVEEFDGFYDLDYVLQVSLRIQSKNLGNIEILTSPKKGGIGETVLLWDTMENGNHVSIKNCD
ncbi:hypothetical protein Ping_2476 [Psychromonas ingrahamii 37]|uniref:Uncharacterized protein n=1 Tax=Psychromonas ingrahamii (strain DSM 17664 / CCUG 51855 / 37) TaxID=357804 RepID=A1SXJ0_PSYIN|nr:hypothetical protein [Psychromonas ingrahamii]ABM04205.1 hypothetical protein Ping_2476 [Psychromonas ingrahamii 37]